MIYFLVSKDEDGGLTLESFEARNTKAALLHVVDAWSGFSEEDDYQECRYLSVEEIGEYLANMNVDSDDIVDLALFEADSVSELGKGNPRRPAWSIFDYVDAKHVF